LLVSEIRNKSITYAFRFRKLNTSPPVEVARGCLTVVCVTHQNGEMRAVAIPKEINEKIEVASAEALKC
jgi:acyl-CoA thioesterase FadM